MLRHIVSSSTRGLAAVLLAATVAWAQAPAAAPKAQAPKAAPAKTATQKPAASKPKVEPAVADVVSPRVLDPSLNDTLRAIRARGTLRACVALTTPWVISDKEQKLSGYSVDIVNQLAEDLNVDPEFVLSALPDVLDRLHRGQCDIIPGAFGPTPQRALFAHFSTPTTVLDLSVVGRKDAVEKWSKSESADGTDVTFGVIEGSEDAGLVARLYPKATLESFSETDDLVKALAEGKVAVAAVSSPLTEFVVEKSGQPFVKSETPIATHRAGIAVRRGDLEFLAYLNTWVQARRDDRWLDIRARRWFKNSDWTPAAPQ